MKKLFFVAAATMLALSSCSDNEINTVVEKAKTPISINVYSQSKTRAVTETTTQLLQAGGFKFVALNGTTEMINTTATYANNVWSYGTDVVYWPTNESTEIGFYGIYPSTIEIDAANDKATFAVDGSTDVVAAYESSSLSNSTSGSVKLAFGHILAEVLVYARGNNDNFTYTVTSLTFSEPANVDYTFSTGAVTPVTGANPRPFTYLNTATTASTEVYSQLGTVVVLPALTTTLTITYTVTDGNGDSGEPLVKTANITELGAGSVNTIYLELPSERTPLTFTVDNVPAWQDGSEQFPDLN